MRIYFCGSIRGGRQDADVYQKIVRKLQTFGEVLTEHVSHSELSEKGEHQSINQSINRYKGLEAEAGRQQEAGAALLLAGVEVTCCHNNCPSDG